MHDLKKIRKDFDTFKKLLKNRSTNIDFEQLINLDKENREFIQKKEILEKEKKIFQNQKISHYILNLKRFLVY